MQRAIKGALDIAAGKDFPGRSTSHHGPFYQYVRVAKCRHRTEIIGGYQDGPAFIAQTAQQGDYLFFGFQIDTRKGFIQQYQLAILGKMARARKTRLRWPPESSPI